MWAVCRVLMGPDATARFTRDRLPSTVERGADIVRKTTAHMSVMKQRMLRGEIYDPDDRELVADQARAQRLVWSYNRTGEDEQEERDRLLRELLGSVGGNVVVKPTFRCDYGTPITIGAGTFVNYDCVMLDVAPITIGSDCRFATRVQLLAGTHPIDPDWRRLGWEYGKPIVIGNNVWLGGGVIVCPNVTIGANTVVGAGSVVTRDLPAGVVAFGVPAKASREITECDRIDGAPAKSRRPRRTC